jgi:hypothetical protein
MLLNKKRIIGAIIIIVALFVPLPSPLSDFNAKIFLAFLGASLVGYEIFFTKRNIVAFIMFFCAVSGILPIDLAPRVILFILALDLITFPLIPSTPIIDISKIVGRIFLVIILFGINALGFGKLGIDVAQIILFVILLTAGDVILSFFSFGIIPWKAIIIFIIGLIWVFNMNWMMALIPAVGEFVLDHIL